MSSAHPYTIKLQFIHDPFGMITPERNWETGSGYRYGFNGQEQDDEVYGNGNVNTAEFWQYDTRLGRRWNVDPVIKSHLSPYATFSNNPIIRIDPDGDDDYFDYLGNYLGTDGSTTNTIRIVTSVDASKSLYTDANKKLIDPKAISDWCLLTDFAYFSDEKTSIMTAKLNKGRIAKVATHYAKELGLADNISVNIYKPKEGKGRPLMYTEGDNIYINIEGGYVSDYLIDAGNLKSSIVHEKDHKNKGHGFKEIDGLVHANVYLNQIKDPTFNKATEEFKKGMVGSVKEYLVEARSDKNANYNDADIESFINNFNQYSSSTGYTLSFRRTGGGQKSFEIDIINVNK